ncbi:hypothetical protein TRIUR3_05420 [Triticum urartu]|uniref:Uncharacterized protein n=1 Tax=Triticum urartu TaxID=4572 RepID=M7ZRP7_TRIUA|nr:hypothetical protein TRIUR3_05420 [Triticum urartu]
MGDGRKSGSGFSSEMVSWFAWFRSPKVANTGDRGTYYPAGGMVVAAKHFSSAHKIYFG